MKVNLSALVITKNAERTLGRALESIYQLADEIIVVDDQSIDATISVAKSYNAKIFINHEYDLGKQRLYAYQKASGQWLLIIDSDEYISPALFEEIKKLKASGFKTKYKGFWVRFQTHFLGRPLSYGGEVYSKLILFKKNAAFIKPSLIHEKYEMDEKDTGRLKNVVYHYSYESIIKMFGKFTDYAIRAAKQKQNKGEKSSFQKIIFYPIHMFWSRFICDKGYKDGLFRLPLDLGFAYMEWLTYVYLAILNTR